MIALAEELAALEPLALMVRANPPAPLGRLGVAFLAALMAVITPIQVALLPPSKIIFSNTRATCFMPNKIYRSPTSRILVLKLDDRAPRKL